MNVDDLLDVVSPVETHNGKTIWMKVGVAFKGDVDNKYAYKLSLTALPVTAFSGEPLELFIFKPNPDQKKKQKTYNRGLAAAPPDDGNSYMPDPMDDDVPF